MAEAAPAHGGIPVRRLGEADAGALGAMLARAFADDPTSSWLFPRSASRAQSLLRWYDLNARILLATGECWGTEDLSSAALWLSTGAERPRPSHLGRLLRCHLAAAAMLGTRLPSAAVIQARVHRLHPREPGWYLAVLATEPGRQGQGLGSAVLAPVLERCDRLGLQAHLDTVTERDVRFYQRRGFRVIGELSPARAPRFWVMMRPPEAPA